MLAGWGRTTRKGDIMSSRWALIASFALALFAAGEVHAQSDTTWDRKAEPIEDRPGEYRTTEFETTIRLTPYAGALIWDRGNYMTDGFMGGLALEFEPADILIASIDFGATGDFENGNRDILRSRYQVERHEKIGGTIYHPALYVGLKNPELKMGFLQPIIGLGFGAFFMRNYKGDVSPLGSGGLIVPDFEVANRTVYHATIFLRFDFDLAENFKLGFNLKNHILFYNSGDEFLGNMENDKFGMDNLHYIFEPSFYLSIAF